jgi:hypothetical protein
MSAIATKTLKAPKSRKSSKKVKKQITSYSAISKLVEVPHDKREALPIGRAGKEIIPRMHHVSRQDINTLKEEFAETGKFPNPHNRGFYGSLTQALVDLGINETHSLPTVMKRVQKLMSDEDTKDADGATAWDRFEKRPSRSKKTGKDMEGRFHQNISVLQRLSGFNPYGRKLLDVGQKVMGEPGGVIDLLVGPNGAQSLRLNTKSAKPINDTKLRGAGSRSTPEGKAAALQAEADRQAKRAERAAKKAEAQKVKDEAKAAKAKAREEKAKAKAAKASSKPKRVRVRKPKTETVTETVQTEDQPETSAIAEVATV